MPYFIVEFFTLEKTLKMVDTKRTTMRISHFYLQSTMMKQENILGVLI